jgi:uncharacterized protein (TIGR02118 family)
MTTLLAIFRRPEGDEEAVSTFLRRYREEHLPMIATTPGLRGTWIRETTQKLMGDDVVIVTGMKFDDRASLDAALTSDAMKAGGRNLREIAPGLVTLLVMEVATELEAAAVPR